MKIIADIPDNILSIINDNNGLISSEQLTILQKSIMDGAAYFDRPHGKWRKVNLSGHICGTGYECQCGRIVWIKEDYCPTCGACMIENTGDPFINDMAARLKAINEKVINSPENRIKAQEGADE